jgi:antitoxin (DNA-binding transcriptional repressor) of toxin-antitoxin stability system
MKTITAREFQKSFGTFTDLVLSGEAVRVTKYGRPAYLILPENDRTADDQRYAAAGRLSSLLKTSTSNSAAKALAFDDVSALIDECFA